MKRYEPMLIGKEEPPFSDPDYLYELKLDGVRCIAYLSKEATELRNKRGELMNARFPELMDMHQQVKAPCVLDGELYVYANERTDFFEMQRRVHTKDLFKIQLLAKKHPATFTAFDVLEVEEVDWTQTPLIKRKKKLQSLLKENERINYSRTVDEQGEALFELTCERNLEGIVAKRKDSLYQPGTKTKDWIKCKNLLDDDFVVVGYIHKEKGIVSLVLAQYAQSKLVYQGHVTMGVAMPYLKRHTSITTHPPFKDIPSGNEEAIWIKPHLVGIVKFMEYTPQGGLRQPVFKGFREDKKAKDCKVPK